MADKQISNEELQKIAQGSQSTSPGSGYDSPGQMAEKQKRGEKRKRGGKKL